eukprot:scaffold7381_cov310-Pinguiococcus_pyrenoidosus.AAC.64
MAPAPPGLREARHPGGAPALSIIWVLSGRCELTRKALGAVVQRVSNFDASRRGRGRLETTPPGREDGRERGAAVVGLVPVAILLPRGFPLVHAAWQRCEAGVVPSAQRRSSSLLSTLLDPRGHHALQLGGRCAALRTRRHGHLQPLASRCLRLLVEVAPVSLGRRISRLLTLLVPARLLLLLLGLVQLVGGQLPVHAFGAVPGVDEDAGPSAAGSVEVLAGQDDGIHHLAAEDVSHDQNGLERRQCRVGLRIGRGIGGFRRALSGLAGRLPLARACPQPQEEAERPNRRRKRQARLPSFEASAPQSGRVLGRHARRQDEPSGVLRPLALLAHAPQEGPDPSLDGGGRPVSPRGLALAGQRVLARARTHAARARRGRARGSGSGARRGGLGVHRPDLLGGPSGLRGPHERQASPSRIRQQNRFLMKTPTA